MRRAQYPIASLVSVRLIGAAGATASNLIKDFEVRYTDVVIGLSLMMVQTLMDTTYKSARGIFNTLSCP